MGCSHIVKKGKNVLSLKTLDHLAPGMAHQASLAKVFPSEVFEHLCKREACLGTRDVAQYQSCSFLLKRGRGQNPSLKKLQICRPFGIKLAQK